MLLVLVCHKPASAHSFVCHTHNGTQTPTPHSALAIEWMRTERNNRRQNKTNINQSRKQMWTLHHSEWMAGWACSLHMWWSVPRALATIRWTFEETTTTTKIFVINSCVPLVTMVQPTTTRKKSERNLLIFHFSAFCFNIFYDAFNFSPRVRCGRLHLKPTMHFRMVFALLIFRIYRYWNSRLIK